MLYNRRSFRHCIQQGNKNCSLLQATSTPKNLVPTVDTIVA